MGGNEEEEELDEEVTPTMMTRREGGSQPPLLVLQARPVNKVTVVVCTGDRGLCGGYNQKMLKLSEKRVAYVLPPLP